MISVGEWVRRLVGIGDIDELEDMDMADALDAVRGQVAGGHDFAAPTGHFLNDNFTYLPDTSAGRPAWRKVPRGHGRPAPRRAEPERDFAPARYANADLAAAKDAEIARLRKAVQDRDVADALAEADRRTRAEARTRELLGMTTMGKEALKHIRSAEQASAAVTGRDGRPLSSRAKELLGMTTLGKEALKNAVGA